MRVTMMTGPPFFIIYQQSGNTSYPSPRMEISLHIRPHLANTPATTKESPKMEAQLFVLPTIKKSLHRNIDHPQVPCPSH